MPSRNRTTQIHISVILLARFGTSTSNCLRRAQAAPSGFRMGFLSASALDCSMLLGTSRVLLEEAGELYSSIIHVHIRLKSDSFNFLGSGGHRLFRRWLRYRPPPRALLLLLW